MPQVYRNDTLCTEVYIALGSVQEIQEWWIVLEEDAYPLQVRAQDGAEYLGHGLVVKLTDADMVEMTSKSGCDEAAATTRGTHRRYKLTVHHLPESVSTVIPVFQSNPHLTYIRKT